VLRARFYIVQYYARSHRSACVTFPTSSSISAICARNCAIHCSRPARRGLLSRDRRFRPFRILLQRSERALGPVALLSDHLVPLLRLRLAPVPLLERHFDGRARRDANQGREAPLESRPTGGKLGLGSAPALLGLRQHPPLRFHFGPHLRRCGFCAFDLAGSHVLSAPGLVGQLPRGVELRGRPAVRGGPLLAPRIPGTARRCVIPRVTPRRPRHGWPRPVAPSASPSSCDARSQSRCALSAVAAARDRASCFDPVHFGVRAPQGIHCLAVSLRPVALVLS
jgi:hypothetical protein